MKTAHLLLLAAALGAAYFAIRRAATLPPAPPANPLDPEYVFYRAAADTFRPANALTNEESLGNWLYHWDGARIVWSPEPSA